MSANFTAGKWQAGQDGDGVWQVTSVSVGSVVDVCDVWTTEDDARLISAAPELLDVAQFFLRGIEAGHIKCAPYIDFDPEATQLEIKSPSDRLRSSIAKATGAA